MDQTPKPNNNDSAEDQATNKRLEALMGPPPREDKPRPAAPASPLPPAPLSAAKSVEADDTKERLLVIPASDKPKVVPKPEPEPPAPQPVAGDTVIPTAPVVSEDMQTPPADEEPKHSQGTTKSSGGKLRKFFRKWWRNRKTRNLTIAAIVAILVGLAVYPTSRYFVLNNVGVRSSASLTVLDNSTQLPLKNVQVRLAGQTAKTDTEGKVKLEHLRLGRSQLDIQKRAFANTTKTITIGWGSNQLGNFTIQPTGSQYTILVKDWLSGKSIAGASASGGDADANADLNGKILLTIDTTQAQQDSLNITVRADNYRDEQISLNLASQANRTVNMVIARKDVFVSNRSGQYDVFSVDVDGKNVKLVLDGSGLEKEDIVLVQHPTDDRAALVSTRVNARNSDGYLLSTLTLINLTDDTTDAIAQSEQVQIVGWIGSRLLYVQIAGGASADDPQRFRLMSYDYKTADKKTLASANAFNDIMLDGNYVYYAPSSAYQKDPNAGLIQSNTDGSVKKTLLADEVWNIFRVSNDKLNLATEQDWFEYTIGSTIIPAKLKEKPANPKNRLYVTSPDNKHSLWVDQRDGKGLLIDYDTAKQVDTTLATQGGLVYPVKWLSNDVLIYRVNNDQQTADYVMNINGGTAHKVTDLYDAAGIDRWYYY